MALVSAIAVGIGGAAGAVSRYAVAVAIERRAIDTFLVNVAGSFLLGVVLGAGIEGAAMLTLAVGYCGAFTTFSSFAVQTVGLTEDGKAELAAVYAGVTLLAAISAAVGGSLLGAVF